MPKASARSQGLRRERMQSCPRFDGRVFRNTSAVAPGLKKGTVLPTLSEYLCGGQRRTPPGPLPVESPLAAWARPPETGLRATWLGHSTVLLEIDGVRLLTDPVWGERASPLRFAGPKRFHPAPAPLASLPPVDAVLLSHDHYDHLDQPTVVELAKMGTPFITSLGVGAHLEGYGVSPERITELDWWESTELRGVRVTAAPSQHFSGRGVHDRNQTAWSSFHARGPSHTLFFSGDTGLTNEYSIIRERLGAPDLVMLEVGAFHPAWGDIHLGPENALAAYRLLGGGALLPVHWGTFNLALHAWDEPAETLVSLAPAHDARLVMPRLGQPVEPLREGRESGIDAWWRAVSEPKAAAALPSGAPPSIASPSAAPEPVAAEEAVQWPLD